MNITATSAYELSTCFSNLLKEPRGYLQYTEGESNSASYCEPKKILEPEDTWQQNFLPKKKIKDINTSIDTDFFDQTDLKI